MARAVSILVLLICLLIVSWKPTLAQGASHELELAASCAFLPEPDLAVNEFLLQHCSDWTNPLLEAQTQPLQLIRCRSLNASGLCYDFYQAQTPSQACERPPPLVTFVHHRHVPLKGSWFWHPWTVATFLSLWSTGTLLVIAGYFVLIIGIGLPGWLIFLFWKELADGLTLGEPFVAEKNEGVYLVQLLTNSPGDLIRTHNQVPSKELEKEVREGKQVGKSVVSQSGLAVLKVLTPEGAGQFKKRLSQTGDCLFLTVMAIAGICCLSFLIITLLSAADNTPTALKCLYPETWLERKGPIRLPEPSQGLNSYLASALGESNITLQLCTTQRLQYYVGSANSCADFGEPYAERLPVAGPKVEDGCPSAKYRTKVLLGVCVGSVCFLALSASCIWSCCYECCLPAGRDRREAAYAARGIELEKLKDEAEAECQA